MTTFGDIHTEDNQGMMTMMAMNCSFLSHWRIRNDTNHEDKEDNNDKMMIFVNIYISLFIKFMVNYHEMFQKKKERKKEIKKLS